MYNYLPSLIRELNTTRNILVITELVIKMNSKIILSYIREMYKCIRIIDFVICYTSSCQYILIISKVIYTLIL